HIAADIRLRWRISHDDIIVFAERLSVDRDLGGITELEAGHDIERLPVRSLRDEAERLHALFDVRARFLEAMLPDAAALPRWIREPRDVRLDAIGGCRACLRGCLDPAREKDIRVVLARSGRAVRREREPLTVRREHRKAVEPRGVRDALEPSAID